MITSKVQYISCSLEIKKEALKLLCYLVMCKEETRVEARESGLLEDTMETIKNYPREDIDDEALVICLELIS